ncbi:hypothetical protein ACRQGU_09400, partial [Actinotignum sp. GS-2025b]|uniref:hypothetical protein n=1 Tax=Actinotignum sp. GS-2025b TaxID=3427275 RepID=UPI003F46E065
PPPPGVVLPTGAPRAVEAEVASAGEAPTQLLCGGGFEQTISAGMTVEGSPGGDRGKYRHPGAAFRYRG